MMESFLKEFLFWGVWLIVPLMIDVLAGLSAAFYGLTKKKKRKQNIDLEYYPYVSIIVPVYNSETTLKNCIKSIYDLNYPKENLEIFLIENGVKDNNSYEIFCDMQSQHTDLRMWWLDSSSGKAKALNKGLYMANGKYIINIDSDGALHKDAIRNMVARFEKDNEIVAMTGTILIDEKFIKDDDPFFKKLMQQCEMLEYAETFLVGRAYETKKNKLFTLAGAFSGFRKEIVLKTQLYNAETLGEDTHMTTQIRNIQKNAKIELCENSFFFVDPVESGDKLYTQRQRWQRGGIEVSSLFEKSSKKIFSILNSTLIRDHTLVFPRLIWMFGMIYLIFIDYPVKLVVGVNLIMYVVYMLLSFIYFIISLLYLNDDMTIKEYMKKHAYIVLILPIYRIWVFFIRAAGIINSMESKAEWKSKTLSQETQEVSNRLHHRLKWFYVMKKWVNCENN